MMTQDLQTVNPTAKPARTIKVMVNASMNTLVKPDQKTPEGRALLQKNRLSNWRMVELTFDQFCALIESGGVWRPAINTVSNKSEDCEEFHCAALDFDGAPYKAEPAGGPRGFCWFTEYQEKIGIAYRTLSWVKGDVAHERIVFFYNRAASLAEHLKVVAHLLTVFDNADNSCKDGIRFFFGSNQPCILKNQDAVLDIDKILAQYPDKPEKKEVPQVKKVKSKSSDQLSELEAVHRSLQMANPSQEYDYEDIINDIYCLHDHQFKSRIPEVEGAVYAAEGRNPYSATDSSGTSFKVTLEGTEEGIGLSRFFDRSNSARSKNRFNEGHGGTHFHYWTTLHPDFTRKDGPLKPTMSNYLLSFFLHKKRIAPSCFGTVRYVTSMNTKLGDSLGWDELNSVVTLDGKPLNLAHPVPVFHQLIGEYHERNSDIILQSFVQAAKRNSYNPWLKFVRDARANYKPSDALWADLPHYLLGIPRDHENYRLFQHYLERWLVAAVARSVYPGIKFDLTLVLWAAQGVGKTSLMDLLFGEFTAEGVSPSNDKDNMMVCHKLICVQLGELAQYTHEIKINKVKLWLTQTADILRLPYAKTPETFLRRFVSVGTTNDPNALPPDDTGNRRFAVLPVISTATGLPVENGGMTEKERQEYRDVLWSTVYDQFEKWDTGSQTGMENALKVGAEFWMEAAKLAQKHTPLNMFRVHLEQKLTQLIPHTSDGVPISDKGYYYVLCTELYNQFAGETGAMGDSITKQIINNMAHMGWMHSIKNRKNSSGKRSAQMYFYIESAKWDNRDGHSDSVHTSQAIAERAGAIDSMKALLGGTVPTPEHRYEVGTAISDKLPDARPTEVPPAAPAQPVAAQSPAAPAQPVAAQSPAVPAQPDEEDEDSPATITDEDEDYRDEVMARSHRPAPAPMDASEAFQRMMELARLANSKD